MRRLAPLLGAFLLTGFGVGLAVCVVEAATRALHLVPTVFWEPDRLLGSRLIPGRAGWWTQEELEFRVPVRINADGFRDLDHSVAKQDGVFRIVLLGDSFVEAMQVRIEDTIAVRLQDRLNASTTIPRYEVLNMGVSGYGTASELLLYRTRARSYRPDVVILAFYPGNDIRNNSPVLEPVLRPAYAKEGTLLRVAGPSREERTGSVVSRLVGASQAYKFLRKLLLTRQTALAETLVRAGLLNERAIRRPVLDGGVPVDYGVYDPSPRAQWEDAWRHTETLLDTLRAEVERDGAQLALIVIGARENVYPDTWEEILATYPAMRERQWDLDQPGRRILRWCARAGIPCLSLSETFQAHRSEGSSLYFRHDGHWTPAGHALAAGATAQFLRENGFLRDK